MSHTENNKIIGKICLTFTHYVFKNKDLWYSPREYYIYDNPIRTYHELKSIDLRTLIYPIIGKLDKIEPSSYYFPQYSLVISINEIDYLAKHKSIFYGNFIFTSSYHNNYDFNAHSINLLQYGTKYYLKFNEVIFDIENLFNYIYFAPVIVSLFPTWVIEHCSYENLFKFIKNIISNVVYSCTRIPIDNILLDNTNLAKDLINLITDYDRIKYSPKEKYFNGVSIKYGYFKFQIELNFQVYI